MQDESGWVARIDIEGRLPVESVHQRLEGVLDHGGARVVLITAERAERLEPAGAGFEWLQHYRLPLVFAWEGALADAALNLALHCDIRVCSETATLQFHAAEAERAGYGRLAMLLPRARAAELGSGIQWSARTAFSMGLASAVVAEGGATAEGQRLAEVVASRGPLAVQLAKEAIWRGLEMPLGQALRFETDLTLLLQTTKDRAEGVAAFLEKRPPHFTGE